MKWNSYISQVLIKWSIRIRLINPLLFMLMVLASVVEFILTIVFLWVYSIILTSILDYHHLIHKLFEQWNLSRIVLTDLSHLTWQQLDNFTVCHLLVVMRIDYWKKLVYIFHSWSYSHLNNEFLELIFVHQSIAIGINLFKHLSKARQELFMLLKLKV